MSQTNLIISDSSGFYDDAMVRSTAVDTYTNVRNSATSNFQSNSGSIIGVFHGHLGFNSAANKMISRGQLAFDIKSSVSDTEQAFFITKGDTVLSAVLQLSLSATTTGFIANTNFGSTHGAKFDFSSDTFGTTTSFDNFVGHVSSGSYSGNVTEYFTAFSNANGGNKNVALNSTGISDIQTIVNAGSSSTQGRLGIVLINSSDFTDSNYQPDPTGGFFFVVQHGMQFSSSESPSSTLRPKLILTTETPSGDIQNSILFGTSF